MDKKSTTKIINKEHYFNKWLMFRRIDEHKKQVEIYLKEQSLDLMLEIQSGQIDICVNKNNELFEEVETVNKEFAWIEIIQNERLYEIISNLSKKEKAILTMRFENLMLFKEIAININISEDNARVTFNNIIKKIKKYYL